jgi:dienelactone hydrolase
MMRNLLFLPLFALVLHTAIARADDANAGAAADAMFADYFRHQTQLVASRSLADIHTLDDWNAKRDTYRTQLAEMLGLHPMPPRTDLKPTITGKIDHDTFTVEKLHFQSKPGLYVTANLYVPKNLTKPAPAILYVCGHGPVKIDGVSYGNKVTYQHHAVWFARNGYVCLVPDTLQMGEIEGIHHGLHREKQWWWISRGYTSAAVEAWNGIRCIDYLQSREEVDDDRIGMTGRSGGGAYSWWTAALDERVKAAVPVAGITDMHNHVVDGVIEGHCDCMYMTNSYRWDFAQVAALVAPRPLLIANSDKDTIFPLSGVQRLHADVARIYKLHNAEKNLGLLITEGPHKDTQDLQVPAFRWFNRHLKNDDGPIHSGPPEKPFTPQQLRVFTPGEEPKDQVNTKIQESFIEKAKTPAVPESKEQWVALREQLIASLRERCFKAWPGESASLDISPDEPRTRDDLRLRTYDFTSEPHVRLKLYVIDSTRDKPKYVALNVLDDRAWDEFADGAGPIFGDDFPDARRGTRSDAKLVLDGHAVNVFLAPRGVGPTRTMPDAKTTTSQNLLRKDTHRRRRFWLLGGSLEGQQVYDVRRALQAVRQIDGLAGMPVHVRSRNGMGGVALYASLFEPPVARLELANLPTSHEPDGPSILNVLKVMDIPTAAALAAERSDVRLRQRDSRAWDFPRSAVKRMGWEGRFEVAE